MTWRIGGGFNPSLAKSQHGNCNGAQAVVLQAHHTCAKSIKLILLQPVYQTKFARTRDRPLSKPRAGAVTLMTVTTLHDTSISMLESRNKEALGSAVTFRIPRRERGIN